MKLVITTFAADTQVLAEVVGRYWPALEHGMLFLCSGGDAGWHAMAAGHAVAPDAEAQPGVDAWRHSPRQQDWHASVCKNVAHCGARVVLQGLTDEAHTVVCNLDCDNVCGPGFLNRVRDHFVREENRRWSLVRSGAGDGRTGRIATTLRDFVQLGGYDCDATAPSGYQDVDLCVRWSAMRLTIPEAQPGNPPDAPRRSHGTQLFLTEEVGGSLNHGGATWVEDRQRQKIINCDRGAWKSWGDMNRYNNRLMTKRLAEGLLVRNGGPLSCSRFLAIFTAAWWQRRLPHLPSGEFDAAPHPAGPISEAQPAMAAAQPAAGQGSVQRKAPLLQARTKVKAAPPVPPASLSCLSRCRTERRRSETQTDATEQGIKCCKGGRARCAPRGRIRWRPRGRRSARRCRSRSFLDCCCGRTRSPAGLRRRGCA